MSLASRKGKTQYGMCRIVLGVRAGRTRDDEPALEDGHRIEMCGVDAQLGMEWIHSCFSCSDTALGATCTRGPS